MEAPMNINQIHQFLVILKYMNMSKASKELFLSQPALSLSINRLEEELGLKLFYRDHNQLTLSSHGMVLEEHFRRLKQDYDVLIQRASDLNKIESKSILLGVTGSIALLSTLYVADFLNVVNGKKIKKVYADEELLMKMLKTGQIDFAITTAQIIDIGMTSLKLIEEDIGLVASVEHPLACRETVSFKELGGYGFTAFRPMYSMRESTDWLCSKNGFQPNYIRECDYNQYYKEIEANRYGAGFLAFCKDTVFEDLFGDGYVFIRLEERNTSITTSLCWDSERKLEYEYADFIDYLVKNFPLMHQKQIQVNKALGAI